MNPLRRSLNSQPPSSNSSPSSSSSQSSSSSSSWIHLRSVLFVVTASSPASCSSSDRWVSLLHCAALCSFFKLFLFSAEISITFLFISCQISTSAHPSVAISVRLGWSACVCCVSVFGSLCSAAFRSYCVFTCWIIHLFELQQCFP